MAKGSRDIILRDRLQFTLDANGDMGLVYGRIDLSDYVNVVEKKGLNVKDIYLQIRDPNNAGSGGFANTGIWTPWGLNNPGQDTFDFNGWKLFVTSRAYENAADVGIASPDVLHCEEYWTYAQSGASPGDYGIESRRHIYPMRDYHPSGYPVVSDLLVGIAVDSDGNNSTWDDATLEVDIMLIAETTSIGAKQMTQLLTQAQDL